MFRTFASSVLRSPDIAEVSAGSIIANEPVSEPVKKKLYAEDLPPEIRSQLKPLFPGSNQARHPLTKQFISLKAKPQEPTPSAQEIPAQPAFEENRETPQNTPQPTAEPEPTATAEPTATPPTDEPGADFSDLPKGDAAPNEPRDPAHEANAHRKLVSSLWDFFVSLCVNLFGNEWLPTSPQERSGVIEAWVDALLWMGTRILNPLQLAYAATASYCFTRLGTLWNWWKNRRTRRNHVPRNEEQTAE
jgi:hypothetical protein